MTNHNTESHSVEVDHKRSVSGSRAQGAQHGGDAP